MDQEKNDELLSCPYKERKENLRRYMRIENKFTCQLEENMQDAFYERYLAIYAPLNAQRDYQGVTIQLWRKNSSSKYHHGN
ncbi:hypothetical protein GCM10023262_05770 [Bartonella pachyuromydis]|uniref:Uncharacterized protein n=1 Tax=Bartonella pachyuromydis TaxID=931097 RepID=A0ABP8VDE6_9HYPH